MHLLKLSLNLGGFNAFGSLHDLSQRFMDGTRKLLNQGPGLNDDEEYTSAQNHAEAKKCILYQTGTRKHIERWTRTENKAKVSVVQVFCGKENWGQHIT